MLFLAIAGGVPGLDTFEGAEVRKLLNHTMNESDIMTEATSVKKRIYNVPRELGNDLVLVDRNILGNLIAEIEDKLDELEAITDPDFMKEVYMRVDEI